MLGKKPTFRQATGQCSVCGKVLARGMRRCAGCRPARGANNGLIMLAVIAAAGGAAYWKFIIPHGDHAGSFTASAMDANAPPPPYVPAIFTGWLHYTTIDPVLKDETRHDRLLGTGVGANSPPTALLELTASAQYGKHVIITFPKVAEACAANQCDVSLAWDGAPPAPFGFYPPATAPGGGTLLQTDMYDRFVKALATAHTLKVAASLGMADDYVFSFPVIGFNAAKSP